MRKSKDRPYVLFVAKIIYSKICDIKDSNPGFSTIDAIDNFIGSETYKEISTGKFHDKWFEELSINNFIDKKKLTSSTIGDLPNNKKLISYGCN